MILFVYVPGMSGPAPQVWHERPTTGAGTSTPPLQEIELPNFYALLPLEQLTTLYPYKPKGAPVDA